MSSSAISFSRKIGTENEVECQVRLLTTHLSDSVRKYTLSLLHNIDLQARNQLHADSGSDKPFVLVPEQTIDFVDQDPDRYVDYLLQFKTIHISAPPAKNEAQTKQLKELIEKDIGKNKLCQLVKHTHWLHSFAHLFESETTSLKRMDEPTLYSHEFQKDLVTCFVDAFRKVFHAELDRDFQTYCNDFLRINEAQDLIHMHPLLWYVPNKPKFNIEFYPDFYAVFTHCLDVSIRCAIEDMNSNYPMSDRLEKLRQGSTTHDMLFVSPSSSSSSSSSSEQTTDNISFKEFGMLKQRLNELQQQLKHCQEAIGNVQDTTSSQVAEFNQAIYSLVQTIHKLTLLQEKEKQVTQL